MDIRLCPYCEGDDIEWVEIDYITATTFVEMCRCYDCNERWYETYQIDHREPYNSDKPFPHASEALLQDGVLFVFER